RSMMRENPDPDIIFMEPCTTTQTQQRGSCRLSTTSWQMFGAKKNASRTSWANRMGKWCAVRIKYWQIILRNLRNAGWKLRLHLKYGSQRATILGCGRRAPLLPAAAGGGAGKVSMQDFHFTMPVNKASPALFLACAQGDHIKNAILTCRKAGKKQQEFMKVTMSDVLVSLFQIGGAVGV